MTGRVALLLALAVVSAGYVLVWALSLRLNSTDGERQSLFPSLVQLATGFVTNFFDTLGIGSFATTTGVPDLLCH